MNYQVWTKDEYEGWKRKDCTDLAAAQVEILLALKAGKEPLLTVELPFSVTIEIQEVKVSETTKSEAKSGEGAGTKGEGEVRPGAASPVPGIGEGSGDNRPNNSV